jgi:hypothetical protein
MYHYLRADFSKNLPAADYAVLAQQYSIPESGSRVGWSRVGWSDLEIKALFEIVASVGLQRASSRSSGWRTSPKWEAVAAELATRGRVRTAAAAKQMYHYLRADFSKNLPAADYAVLDQKYSIHFLSPRTTPYGSVGKSTAFAAPAPDPSARELLRQKIAAKRAASGMEDTAMSDKEVGAGAHDKENEHINPMTSARNVL